MFPRCDYTPGPRRVGPDNLNQEGLYQKNGFFSMADEQDAYGQRFSCLQDLVLCRKLSQPRVKLAAGKFFNIKNH